jgi:hypothetical protein
MAQRFEWEFVNAKRELVMRTLIIYERAMTLGLSLVGVNAVGGDVDFANATNQNDQTSYVSSIHAPFS